MNDMDYPTCKYYQLGSYIENADEITFTWNGNMGNTVENDVIPMMEYYGFDYYDMKNSYRYEEDGYPDYQYKITFYK